VLAGVLGALVAVPLAASLQVIIREATAERRAQIAELRAQAPVTPA
jgi:predicted PurR-regulated permease PerM